MHEASLAEAALTVLLQPYTPGTMATKDLIYGLCLWSLLLSLFLQSLPRIRERRQATSRLGPLVLLALTFLTLAMIYDQNEHLNLLWTVLGVACILLNDWVPVIFFRRPPPG